MISELGDNLQGILMASLHCVFFCRSALNLNLPITFFVLVVVVVFLRLSCKLYSFVL
ncbi:hypothetical protein BJX66DRAFT_311523, partial [Aspergillus keveii]